MVNANPSWFVKLNILTFALLWQEPLNAGAVEVAAGVLGAVVVAAGVLRAVEVAAGVLGAVEVAAGVLGAADQGVVGTGVRQGSSSTRFPARQGIYRNGTITRVTQQ